jgi:hypothetical protein
MISSITGEHSTRFSQLIFITWVSTLLSPVGLYIVPLESSYIPFLLVCVLILTVMGCIGLNFDMLQVSHETDWSPTKLYYFGVLPSPTSFFILGFYLGFRDRAYDIGYTNNSSEEEEIE